MIWNIASIIAMIAFSVGVIAFVASLLVGKKKYQNHLSGYFDHLHSCQYRSAFFYHISERGHGKRIWISNRSLNHM